MNNRMLAIDIKEFPLLSDAAQKYYMYASGGIMSAEDEVQCTVCGNPAKECICCPE